MSKRLILGVLLAVAAIFLVACEVEEEGEDSTRAEGETVEMGIDPEVTGNTASTLGTLEDCVRVDVASPAFDGISDYNIDVYVQGNTLAPLGYDAYVTYDATKVHIAAPGTNALIKMPGASPFSDALPDTDGRFVAAAAYLSGGPGTAGDGTLVRLGLDIGGAGVVTFDFDLDPLATAYSSPSGEHPVTRRTAQLAINEDCPRGGGGDRYRVEETPTATPAADEMEQRRQEEERLRVEDFYKPKFEGVVNGIRLYSTKSAGAERTSACTNAKPEEVQHVDLSAVAGTPMEIVPTYLPLGAKEMSDTFPPVICKGTIAYVERKWITPDNALITINRRQGEHAIGNDAPAERISAATVAGKPAVLFHPVFEGEDSGVVIAEDFGITSVRVFALPLDEAIKIAEGLE
jgi:hypothetical protein